MQAATDRVAEHDSKQCSVISQFGVTMKEGSDDLRAMMRSSP